MYTSLQEQKLDQIAEIIKTKTQLYTQAFGSESEYGKGGVQILLANRMHFVEISATKLDSVPISKIASDIIKTIK